LGEGVWGLESGRNTCVWQIMNWIEIMLNVILQLCVVNRAGLKIVIVNVRVPISIFNISAIVEIYKPSFGEFVCMSLSAVSFYTIHVLPFYFSS